MSAVAWLAFLVAAGVGAAGRYLLNEWVRERVGEPFPWGTIVVNLSGCAALGLLTGLGLYHGLGSTARTVVGTGGLGAFTTFSTFSYETVALADRGDVGAAAANVAVSILGGLAAAAAGLAVAAAL